MKISVCIPSRAQALGLWATICGCANALEDIEHEFIVAVNGRKIDDEETKLLYDSADSRVTILQSDNVLSPTEARDLAASHAKGEYICFFDDHCIPSHDWFYRVLFNGHDVLHSSLSAAPGRSRVFHFIPNPGALINGHYERTPAFSKTYRVLSGPAAGFAIKRAVWENIGGYGDHFEGFGGEEAFLNIKAQMLGHYVWLDPEMLYYHFYTTSGVRGYERIHNCENWQAGAYILGGQEWADRERNYPYVAPEKIQRIHKEFQARVIVPVDKVLTGIPDYSTW